MSGPSDVSDAAAPIEETYDGVILRVRVRPARRAEGSSASPPAR